jgi:hypothetical protein
MRDDYTFESMKEKVFYRESSELVSIGLYYVVSDDEAKNLFYDNLNDVFVMIKVAWGDEYSDQEEY